MNFMFKRRENKEILGQLRLLGNQRFVIRQDKVINNNIIVILNNKGCNILNN